jgi:hypothetical protein
VGVVEGYGAPVEGPILPQVLCWHWHVLWQKIHQLPEVFGPQQMRLAPPLISADKAAARMIEDTVGREYLDTPLHNYCHFVFPVGEGPHIRPRDPVPTRLCRHNSSRTDDDPLPCHKQFLWVNHGNHRHMVPQHLQLTGQVVVPHPPTHDVSLVPKNLRHHVQLIGLCHEIVHGLEMPPPGRVCVKPPPIVAIAESAEGLNTEGPQQ